MGTKVLVGSMSYDLLLDSINFYNGEPSQGEGFTFPVLVVTVWASESKSMS